jgi:lipopolysaccharide/colanic/teichoic acid biosynthesis glycosyltransferase
MMLHATPLRATQRASLFSRRRAQLAGALIAAALMPYLLRSLLWEGTGNEATSLNALGGNVVAVILAMWVRMSVETYPGVRASALNLPVASICHMAVMVAILLLRLDYDRLALLIGYIFHLLWLYAVYFTVQRGSRPAIAIVPWGAVERLSMIDSVDWHRMREPRLDEVVGYQAIVADFGADLPENWERFLADAALDGRIVYQVKQLSESLTGRVEIEHISENSFGSLMPARGYFHFKELADLLFSLLVLPVALPLIGLVALAILAERDGPVFFRQRRVGYSGRPIEVLKFRTMVPLDRRPQADARTAAMTTEDDARITRLGAFLRRSRIDELPQIWNVLKGEMSWIGPRPEAEVLSIWYTSEIPFYRYRHVVKPGISGWAAVNQGHVANVDDVHRKLQYDFYYIKYFSPWLDLLIVFRTIKTMLTGFGSR